MHPSSNFCILGQVFLPWHFLFLVVLLTLSMLILSILIKGFFSSPQTPVSFYLFLFFRPQFKIPIFLYAFELVIPLAFLIQNYLHVLILKVVFKALIDFLSLTLLLV